VAACYCASAQIPDNCAGTNPFPGIPGINKGLPVTNDLQLQTILLKITERIARLERVFRFSEKFQEAGGKIFATNGKQVDFETSKLTCEKAGGRIATPKNEVENKAILNIITERKLYAYLGIIRGKILNKFTYLDGTPIAYANWSKSEPNGKGAENCVEIYTNGSWNDKGCNQNRLTICEFSVNH
ncbi:hypothetical protein GDO86_013106, partial [Hymenochirus boettgeri]